MVKIYIINNYDKAILCNNYAKLQNTLAILPGYAILRLGTGNVNGNVSYTEDYEAEGT